jgi:hypothetical protein
VITYSAVSEGVTLQGVKDPRGTTGIHATRKREPRCSQPPLGGPDQVNVIIIDVSMLFVL